MHSPQLFRVVYSSMLCVQNAEKLEIGLKGQGYMHWLFYWFFSSSSRRSSVDPDPPSIITDPSVVLSPSEIDPSDLDDVS